MYLLFFFFFFNVFIFFFFFFFFSSRRRHTRSLRDWSSDVCSSDLFEPHVENVLAFLQVLAAALRARETASRQVDRRLHEPRVGAFFPENVADRKSVV